MAKIVLASGSPRRQELLRRMGITEFDIRVPEVEESYPDHLSPEEIVKFISREKSTERELRAYIRTGEPMDKAGAYGVQGKGALLVERIDGDFFNVMGLPVGLLARLLKGFGIDLME